MKKTTILFIIIICSLSNNNLFSKSIKVFTNDISKYPEVTTKIMSFGNNGVPNLNLQSTDFKVKDNNSNRKILNYVSEPSTIDNKVSMLVLFDLNINNNNGNFLLAKNLIKEIISIYDFNQGECGVLSFDLNAYFNSYFTQNVVKVTNSLEQLYPYIASDYNSGFFGEPLGAFKDIKEAKFKKHILLITDGYGKISTQSILDSAKAIGVTISILNLQRTITPELEQIANSTNGYYLDKISNEDDVNLIGKTMLSMIYGYKPSKLIWQSNLNCDEIHKIDLSLLTDTNVTKFEFKVADTLKPRLEFDPPYLRFSSVLPNTSKAITVNISAKNGDITLYKLKIEDSNNGIFNITNGNINKPILIPQNTSHSFTLNYLPVDSAIVFTRILIESNGCFGNEILVTGGFPNTPPNTKTIKMVTPNECNEILVGSEYYNVTWAGLLPKDVIQLDYSLDNGLNWNVLSTNVTGLEHQWFVPKIQTDKGLIKITQLWPNNVGRTLNFPHPFRQGFDSRFDVNSAFFNIDGTKIVTACKDGIVRTWNANNGTLEFVFEGHSDEVNYAVFSPDGQFIVSSCFDYSVIVWNAYTGKLVKRINLQVKPNSVNYNFNGSKIIVACSDGKFRIYDNVLNIEYTSNNIGIGSLNYGMFSPIKNYAAVGGANGVIKIIDITSYSNIIQIGSFNTRDSNASSQIFSFDISPDEKKIVISEIYINKVSLWDFNTKKRLFKYDPVNENGFSNRINKVSFGYYGKTESFFTSGLDGIAKQWDANTGDSIRQFKEHSTSVTSAVANFDGSRVLTASWDGLAKIWNLNEKDLQLDTTDCTFKIGIAKASMKSIDFGDVVLKFEKDSIIKNMIYNISAFPYQVKSISIVGANKDDYKLLSSGKPFILDSNSIKEIEIAFNPQSIGLKQAQIMLVIPGDTVYTNLRGLSVAPSINLIEKYVDFSNVELGDYKDKTANYLIKNNTSNDINLDSIFVSIPNTNYFRLTDVKNKIVKPNEGAELSLRFNPQVLGNQNSTAIFRFNGNNSPIKVPMIGKGIASSVDTASLSLSPIVGKPGDYVNMDIKLIKNSDIPFKNTFSGIKTYLKFNSTLLQPVSGYKNSVINGNERTIEIEMKFPETKLNQVQVNEEIVIGSIRFKVALGNDSTTKIKLFNSQPVGYDKVLINESSTIFRLEGFCKDGEIRLFNDTGKLYLNQNFPNPAGNNTIIDYEIIEKGNSSLRIYDNSGKIVRVVFDESKPTGAYEVTLDTSTLPIGQYFYVLNTPTQELIKRLEVRR